MRNRSERMKYSEGLSRQAAIVHYIAYLAKTALLFGWIKWTSAGAQSMSDV